MTDPPIDSTTRSGPVNRESLPGRSHPRPSRVPAAVGGLAVAVGAVLMSVALAAVPGLSTQGYVSEAGTVGMPLATVYRSGLTVLAVGVALLAVALSPAARLAGGLLGAAGLLAGTSGAVPCSAGCPLPPYESSTAADLVHTGVSIVGMGVLAVAMVAVAAAPALTSALRRLAASAAALTFPIALLVGVAMVSIGRAPLTAVTERLLLGVAVCWLVATACVVAADRCSGDAPHDRLQ